MAKRNRAIAYDNSGFAKYLTAEQREHARLVEYLRWMRKDALWLHPVNEGKRSAFERFLWSIMGGKKSASDFLFFNPRHGYTGLAIELKATGETVFRKDGAPYSDKKDQHDFLQALHNCGWYATFAIGFDQAHRFVEAYYAAGPDDLKKMKPLI